MSESRVGKELIVRNHLKGEVQVTMYRGMCTIDLTKCKPPVIITLSPGQKTPGLEDLLKLDTQHVLEPIRRPQFGAR